MFSLPWSDACRLATGRDALISWRALSERSELVRLPKANVRLIQMRPDGASMVLGPFAPHKGFALRNEPNDGCALRDAASNKLGRLAETGHLS